MTTSPGALPTVDVQEADRRLREDAPTPLLLDVREPNEFQDVRAPGAALVPTSQFMARVAELPTDRPILVICHSGGRSAAVTGYLARTGSHGRGQRGRRHARLGAGRPAGPAWTPVTRRGRPALELTSGPAGADQARSS